MTATAPRSLLASLVWAFGVILAVGSVVAFIVLRDDSSGPKPPRDSLSDADKAALIRAARVLAEFEDPAEVGPPEQVQEFRRLAERIEAGDLGVSWQRFRSSVSSRVLSARIAASSRSTEEERVQQRRRLLDNFAKFVSALDAGDLAAAQSAP